MVDEVVYLATLGGAEAVYRESEIGSLEMGKLADVIIINTFGTSYMIASADLVAAIVMHATPSNVKTVIVDGEIAKRDRVLPRVNWDESKEEFVRNRIELEEMYKHVD
jgi:cytosine/adenosine deaminase-related metal-dependent hydrolase